jgi:hypothetical protein
LVGTRPRVKWSRPDSSTVPSWVPPFITSRAYGMLHGSRGAGGRGQTCAVQAMCMQQRCDTRRGGIRRLAAAAEVTPGELPPSLAARKRLEPWAAPPLQ